MKEGEEEDHEANEEDEHDEDLSRARSLTNAAEPIPQASLRKYLAYAKENCHPKLQQCDYDKITNVYTELRRQSNFSQGMPIAVRHLESIIRMSEAHARMHMREYVSDDDIDMAIRCMLESFISTQKLSVQKAMRRKFQKYITYKRDFNELALHTLRQMVRDTLQAERVLVRSLPDMHRPRRIPVSGMDNRHRFIECCPYVPRRTEGTQASQSRSRSRYSWKGCVTRPAALLTNTRLTKPL